ncbi:hypothetical protein L0F63_004075, partial [Massospora cicadina]
PEVAADLTRIPHTTVFHLLDGGVSKAFHITLERAPPICNHCTTLGHKEHAFSMKEDILAPDFCDNTMDEDDEDFAKIIDSNYHFLWGKNGQYIPIDPVSPNLRKMVQKACKWAAVKAASLAASSINPSQIQEDIEEINQANQSEQNSQAEEGMVEINQATQLEQ